MNAETCVGASLPESLAGHYLLAKLGAAQFLVRVLESDAQSIRVTFPGSDNPLEDTWLRFEFHDDEGVTAFRARVIEGGRGSNSGLLLEYPSSLRRTFHRDAFRAPTDLVAQVRDQEHGGRYSADVLNLSSGGALLQLDVPIGTQATLDVRLAMPRHPRCQLLGEVIHSRWRHSAPIAAKGLYGIRFIEPDDHTRDSLSRYVGERLRHLCSVD